jgi:hypothetical protein
MSEQIKNFPAFPEQAYILVKLTGTLEQFAQEITDKIQKGYAPLGAPFEFKGELFQAMTWR